MLLQKIKNIESRKGWKITLCLAYCMRPRRIRPHTNIQLSLSEFIGSYEAIFFNSNFSCVCENEWSFLIITINRICLVLLQKFINFNFKYVSVTRVTVFDWLDWTILIVLELLFVGKIKYCQWYIDVNGAQRPKPITWQLHLYAKQIKQ